MITSIGLAVACGSTGTATVPAPVAAPAAAAGPTTSSEAATTSPRTFTGFVGTVNANDHDGYLYGVTFDFGLSGIEKNVEQSKPGQAQLIMSLTGSFSVSNNTPDRQAPLGRLGEPYAAGIWPASSALCTANRAHLLAGIQEVRLSQPAGEYCVLVIGIDDPAMKDGSRSDGLAVGQTLKWQVDGETRNLDIAEADYSTVTTALTEGPAVWALILDATRFSQGSAISGIAECSLSPYGVGLQTVLWSSKPIAC